MHITFGDSGNAKVGFDYDDKEDEWLESFTSCRTAWERGKSNGEYTIRLESAWLLDGPLTLDGNRNVRIDLNGYPIIRSMKKTDDDGEVFKIDGGGALTIVDSAPSRPGNGNFTGGSIQGGRSDNTAGLIECQGTLNMTGGTLYNGGTTDKGGAIKLTGNGVVNLNGTLISNCWTDKARSIQNEGGAIYMSGNAKANLKNCTIRYCRALDYGGGIYMEDSGNALNCENVHVIACKTNENLGAGVYQDLGETNWIGGSIKSCRAEEDDGGGFYQDEGKVYMENVRFASNYSEDNGGAFYSNTDDGTWFIGCDFVKNRADDNGGAIYLDNNYLYLEDCTVTSNTSGGTGGGLYIDSAGSVDVYGKVIIKNNDGTGTMDNLVLESGAFIYDHGLFPGSEIHLRSESSGDVKIGNGLTSDYQMVNYFVPDYGHLELVDTADLNTELRASTFHQGKTAMVVGIAVIMIAIAGAVFYKKKQRKEEHNETE